MYSVSNGGSLRIRMQSSAPSGSDARLAEGEPAGRVGPHGERPHAPAGDAVAQQTGRAARGRRASKPRAWAASSIASVESFAYLMAAMGSITTPSRLAVLIGSCQRAFSRPIMLSRGANMSARGAAAARAVPSELRKNVTRVA